jgi:glycine/D-amino acid oxidase-like deaminating enzyme
MNREVARSLAGSEPTPYWLDDPAAPEPAETLVGSVTADLAVVGGGFSGLWTALLAKERDPSRDVVLLEAATAGWAASGRNGGFCSSSLTHGYANGLSRFPQEIDRLEALGRENLDEMGEAIERYKIDCSWERTGDLSVATEDWQAAELREAFDAAAGGEAGTDSAADGGLRWLDAEAMRAEVHSPTYVAGIWDRDGCALVNPARLAWGLRRACTEAGVRCFDHSTVRRLSPERGGVELTTDYGQVRADRVALGTNAFPSLLRRLRPFTIPVYDYVLMTEPLSDAQMAAVGWVNRQGIGDSGNQFHYYRLSDDNRILWGGYDAVYHSGKHVRPEYDQRPATFVTLAEHFFATFPQLEGVRFTHRWGGAIDTCSRFCAFYGRAHRGRVAYATGYTGLGVGATRFGANVMLDLLSGQETERTTLKMVRTKPIPFPPEPLATAAIQATRWSIAQADRHAGKRNVWLRTLDAIGAGFDS